MGLQVSCYRKSKLKGMKALGLVADISSKYSKNCKVTQLLTTNNNYLGIKPHNLLISPQNKPIG